MIKLMKSVSCILFFLLLCPPVFSRVYINIGAPDKVQKSIVALSPFTLEDSSGSGNLSYGNKMSRRLEKNLKFSGYFNILSPKGFIENPVGLDPIPYPKSIKGFRWDNWRLAGADFLFFASYSIEGGEITIKVSFYNINLRRSLLKKKYTGTTVRSNQLVDKLSNDIIKKLSGKKGVFETKILSTRSTGGTKKELFIMDWNGENKRRLTYHRSIVLSPVWSNSGKKTAYSAFVYNKKLKKRVPALFLYNFAKNTIKLISARNGSNLGSDFFPDERYMLVTLGIGKGLMDIFKLHIKTRALTPLTRGPFGAINVEPNIHPRTRQIAFSSDRKGKTMIYTMSPKGRNIKQITFAGQHNSNPEWHPEKAELIFSGLSKGRMDLFRISSKGTGLRRLSSLRKKNGQWANCESPSYSPDGRFIVFSSDVSGTYQLYVMNLDNLSIERITFDRHNYKSPKWSPYL